jgi:hypothetical protein
MTVLPTDQYEQLVAEAAAAIMAKAEADNEFEKLLKG